MDMLQVHYFTVHNFLEYLYKIQLKDDLKFLYQEF
jgi:hypothetical protein